jgi:hypothetical protein
MGKNPPIVQEVTFASSDKAESKTIASLLKKKAIRKIAPRLYTSNFTDKPASIIKRNWFQILAGLYPETLLSHRSALEARPTTTGHIFLTHTYNDKVKLPGLTIHFLKGPGRTDGDNPLFDNLFMSQEARAFLENMQTARKTKGESKTLTTAEIEERLEAIARVRGEAALNTLRDTAKKIAGQKTQSDYNRYSCYREFKKFDLHCRDRKIDRRTIRS